MEKLSLTSCNGSARKPDAGALRFCRSAGDHDRCAEWERSSRHGGLEVDEPSRDYRQGDLSGDRGGLPFCPLEQGFDFSPDRQPRRPLGSTPFDLKLPRSQGRSLASSEGLASLARHSAALSFLPQAS